MSFNLLETIKGFIGENLINSLASKWSESDSSVAQAVKTIVPSAAMKLINHSESNTDEAFSLAQTAHKSGILDNIIGLANSAGDWGNTAKNIIQNLFGDHSENLSAGIAKQTGISETSSQKLINIVGPIVIGCLGKHAAENRMDAGSFGGFLGSIKPSIAGLIPSGFNLDSILTTPKAEPTITVETVSETPKHFVEKEEAASPIVNSNSASTAASVAETTGIGNNENETSSGGAKWLLPLFLLGLVGAGGWWLWKQSKNPPAANISTIDSLKNDSLINNMKHANKSGYDSISGNYLYELGEMIKITLPNNGGVLEVGKNSTENKLFTQLSDVNWKVSEDKKIGWEHFDRIFFKSGASELDSQSMKQIKNIASILKAYPTAILKIGGYTDNSGDSLSNVALSAARSKMVADMIVKAGVPVTNIAFEGYGPMHPVCAANNTPECKAQNRRVDFRLKSK